MVPKSYSYIDDGKDIFRKLESISSKRWRKEPNIHNKELIMDHPKPRDKSSKSYEYFM